MANAMNPGIDALRARFIIEISKAAKNSRRLQEAFQGIDRADFVPATSCQIRARPLGGLSTGSGSAARTAFRGRIIFIRHTQP